MRIFDAGIYDFAAFGVIFIIFVIIFLGALIAPKRIQIPLICIALVVFIAAPFINALIVNKYINKVDLALQDSRKLEYIDSFFIQGTLTNRAWHALSACNLYVYVNKIYPFQKPEYVIKFEGLNLARDAVFEFDRVIDDFSPKDAKKIAALCY